MLLSLLACQSPADHRPAHAAPARLTDGETTVLSPEEPTGTFGFHTTDAGDLNDDGYDDVAIMGKITEEDGTQLTSVHLFFGSPDGLDPDTEVILTGGEYDDDFGRGLAGPIDLNGDGFDDLVVGASGHSTYGYSNAGAVFLYYGTSSGVLESPEARYAVSPEQTDRFGWALAAPGDVDGDGLPDLLVNTYGGSGTGTVTLFTGGSDGLSGEATVFSPPSQDDTVDRFGRTLSEAGDINGDGYQDALIGVWTEDENGAAYPLYGGVEMSVTISDRLSASNSSLSGLFSEAISEAGDVDGDGFDDVIIGAYRTKGEGTAYLYYGSPDGLDVESEVKLRGPGTDGQEYYAHAVTSVGDANGDGYDDVLVGSPRAGVSGTAYFYPGGPGGIDPDAAVALEPTVPMEYGVFGTTLSEAGDVDGDGGPDVLISADGRVYLFSGEPFVDEDGDGVPAATDCDDADASTGGPDDWYTDADGDGYGNPDSLDSTCSQPDGAIADGTDCDDADDATFPGAPESCDDGLDRDCDGEAPDCDEASGGCGEGCSATGGASALWVLTALLLGGRRRVTG